MYIKILHNSSRVVVRSLKASRLSQVWSVKLHQNQPEMCFSNAGSWVPLQVCGIQVSVEGGTGPGNLHFNKCSRGS